MSIQELSIKELAEIAADLAVECARRSEVINGDAQWTLELAAGDALRLKSCLLKAYREVLKDLAQ